MIHIKLATKLEDTESIHNALAGNRDYIDSNTLYNIDNNIKNGFVDLYIACDIKEPVVELEASLVSQD